MLFKKVTLDESLFDDDSSWATSFTDTAKSGLFDMDDDLFSVVDMPEDEHSVENVPAGPAEGTDSGVASELIALINDEWEAIQGYNNAIATLRAVDAENSFYTDAVRVLEEIAAEENRHVGQLQEVLKRISPNASEIEKGTTEAKDQLRFVNGKLPVQTHTPIQTQQRTNNTPVDDLSDECTLDNCDDTF